MCSQEKGMKTVCKLGANQIAVCELGANQIAWEGSM
jgi:hypothetical protein